ncbi:MAG: TldD/PmbA family protein [Oscillospiraceae bacterium]|jgi:PmbA protein|nr:TldD/PmbA family protein [Oscillospiraceae bacterium]
MSQKLTQIAEYALEALRRAGATGAEVAVSRGEKDELTADAGRFTLLRTTRSGVVSMKALVDGRKGVSALNSLEKEALDACARECVESARGAQPDPAEEIAPLTENGEFVSGVPHADRAALYDRAAEFLTDVERDFPTVCLEQVTADYARDRAVYLNTNGVRYEEEGGEYGFSAMFSAKEGVDASSFNYFGVTLDNLDTPFISLGNHRQQLEQSTASVRTVPFGEKLLGSIVLTPECFGELLSEALGIFCGNSAIIESTSPWKDKLGTAVAAPLLTVSAKPYDRRVVCGERICEGERSRDADIIRGGVLQSFLLTRYAANKTGHSRFPNGGGHIVVEGGSQPLAQLIAGAERGLLVGRFSGGQPGGNGDFSGVAKNSFLIENGQITRAVSETMISGNLQELLKNIRALSAETLQDGNVILPYALCDGVTMS